MAKKENSKEIQNKNHQNNPKEPEIFDNLPPEIKKVTEMGFSMQRFSGPMPNPIVSKLNENHIDRILDISEKEEENAYKDSQSNKIYNLIYVLIIVIFFVFLVVFLENKELLVEILKIVIAIVGGFGGGFGYKTYLDRKKSSK